MIEKLITVDVPIVTFDPKSVIGAMSENCEIEIIDEPQWRDNKWVALARVGEALALVEIKITIKGNVP